MYVCSLCVGDVVMSNTRGEPPTHRVLSLISPLKASFSILLIPQLLRELHMGTNRILLLEATHLAGEVAYSADKSVRSEKAPFLSIPNPPDLLSLPIGLPSMILGGGGGGEIEGKGGDEEGEEGSVMKSTQSCH